MKRIMRQNMQKELRWGYSTGACAAAAAMAAWESLRNGKTPESVCLLFPDGKKRKLPLLRNSKHMAGIRKDAGDDPDCTHGATIYADIRACSPAEAKNEDYTLAIGNGAVILRGGEGVGLCTRPGLDCAQGHWAINAVPRRMIADNLQRAGLNTGCWLLEISVENGREIAKRTLNPQLGIVNGISLLGTSGLVRPHSHAAYIDTIRVCVKAHALSGGSSIVFCTGGRTERGARKMLPTLPGGAFIRIGDFIAESLAAACQHRLREIIIACMAGKLCKYASGFGNTHAHKNRQDMEFFRSAARRELPAENGLHGTLGHCASVREALLSIPSDIASRILRSLARTALEQFIRHCGGEQNFHLFLFDFEGEFLLEESRLTDGKRHRKD